MFYLQARYLKVDRVIWNYRIWSAANGGPRPQDRDDPHTNHIHVAFADDHLEELPRGFVALLKLAAAAYVAGGDGAADRHNGLYGPAFNPRSRLNRLTPKQRKTILLKNMGMEGADDF